MLIKTRNGIYGYFESLNSVEIEEDKSDLKITF